MFTGLPSDSDLPLLWMRSGTISQHTQSQRVSTGRFTMPENLE